MQTVFRPDYFNYFKIISKIGDNFCLIKIASTHTSWIRFGVIKKTRTKLQERNLPKGDLHITCMVDGDFYKIFTIFLQNEKVSEITLCISDN